MRPGIAISLLVGAVCAPASINAYEFNENVVIQTTKRDGTEIGLIIKPDAIRQTPQWNPADGSPPLSIAQAYRIALDWAQREYARYDSVSVGQISLVKWQHWRASNRWYYRFDLVPMMEGNSLHGSGNWAAVLMDGTVIGPTVLP